MNASSMAGLFTEALSESNRAIRIRLWKQASSAEEVLLVKAVNGREIVCGGIEYRLFCLSTQTLLPLKDLIALPVEIQFVTDRGQLRSVCGVVAQACAGQSDGGLATYQLVLRDALSLMAQRINTRVFRNQNEIDISLELVREWRQSNPILASAFDIDTSGISATYPAREFTMQHNESDTAFLQRLWKRQGIAWCFRPAALNGSVTAGAPAHTLVLFDDPFSLSQNAAGAVRFHRDAATEARDSVFNWSAVRSLRPGVVARQSWDYLQGRMQSTQSPATIQQGEAGDAFAFGLEDHRIDAPHVGEDDRDYRRLGDLRIQRHEYEAKCFHGEGGVRDMCVGQWFRLDGHPEIDTHAPGEREFVLTELSLTAENNLPKDIDERARRLFGVNAWHDAATAEELVQASSERDVKFTNRFTCVRRGIAIVPSYDPHADLPPIRLQSAFVVGPPGEEVYCDEFGRVKLRFPGTREEDHPRGGASDTDRDSAWVRVASYWASDRWGGLHLPRVGDEVVVDFLGGDPDKPIVVGRLYAGRARPAAFSHHGALPGNRFMSGVKTKEVQGQRHNQLRFDDTPGEISAQLASEHAHSQLNLGWLSHPRRDGDGQARGAGAELRSDQAVVIRAARTLLLTTQAMLGGTGKQLEREPLQGLVEGAQGLVDALGKFAEQHQALPVDIAPIKEMALDLKDAEQAGAPLIAQYGHGGFVSATPKSMLSYSGRQYDIVAQQHLHAFAGQAMHLQAGKGMSLFAHQGGMKHIARAGKLEIQAQQDSIALAADQDMKLTASQGEITIAAKKSITLACGGAYLKIADGKIELGCSGDFTVKAGAHKWDGPASMEAELPFFPAAEHGNWLKLDLDGYQGAPMAGVPYTLHFANGQTKNGTLDGNGLAEERNLPDSISKVVYHNPPSAEDASRPHADEFIYGLGPLVAQEPGTVDVPRGQGDT